MNDRALLERVPRYLIQNVFKLIQKDLGHVLSKGSQGFWSSLPSGHIIVDRSSDHIDIS